MVEKDKQIVILIFMYAVIKGFLNFIHNLLRTEKGRGGG